MDFDVEYLGLVYFHLVTVVLAFVIGTYLLIKRKGTKYHKILGRFYMVLMLLTAISTLFIPAQVGGFIFYHFGYIHILSFITLYTVPEAYIAIKKHNVKKHRNSMIILYVSAILIAGTFAFTPVRLLHTWLFV